MGHDSDDSDEQSNRELAAKQGLNELAENRPINRLTRTSVQIVMKIGIHAHFDLLSISLLIVQSSRMAKVSGGWWVVVRSFQAVKPRHGQ